MSVDLTAMPLDHASGRLTLWQRIAGRPGGDNDHYWMVSHPSSGSGPCEPPAYPVTPDFFAYNTSTTTTPDIAGFTLAPSYSGGASGVFYLTNAGNGKYTVEWNTGRGTVSGYAGTPPDYFQFPTTGQAPPTGVAASQGNTPIVVSWTAASGATSYNVYRSTDGGATWGSVPIATGLHGTSYSDTSALPNTRYTYAVTAVSATESAKSSLWDGWISLPLVWQPDGFQSQQITGVLR